MAGATIDLRAVAQQALAQMRAAGFEHAQVTASQTLQTEVSIAHDEPSLLRSTQAQSLSLLGIVDQRIASTELADFAPDAMRARMASLVEDARSAPRDEANAVSSGQSVRIAQGPLAPDLDLLTGKAAELLAFRAKETPQTFLRSAEAQHQSRHWHTLTSGGSDIAGSLGCYSLSAMGVGRQGGKSSSINFAAGYSHDLAAPVEQLFGLGRVMRELPRQVHTQPLGRKFTGDVILAPQAVGALIGWLLGQLGDMQLIAGSSLYRDRVGQPVASPLLTLRSRFDGPGVAAVSGDAFATPPVTLLDAGTLRALVPTLYGSRKTSLPHVPVAASGWEIVAGDAPLEEMIASVRHGAVVGRLSMGNPAANGDFSSIIKNSFLVEGGTVGPALTESMIAGNMAQMLLGIVGVSRECIDTGETRLPWLRIAGLHFS
jgi:PmbA protein